MRASVFLAVGAMLGATDALAIGGGFANLSSFQPGVGLVEAGTFYADIGSLDFVDLGSNNRAYAATSKGKVSAYAAVDSLLNLTFPPSEGVPIDVANLPAYDQSSLVVSAFDDSFTVETASTATVNGFFSRTLAVGLGGPASRYTSLLSDYRAANGLGTNAEIKALVSVDLNFGQQVSGIDATGTVIASGAISGRAYSIIELTISLNSFNGGFRIVSSGFDQVDAGNDFFGPVISFDETFEPLDGPYTSAQNHSFDFTYLPGISYEVALFMECSVKVQGAALLSAAILPIFEQNEFASAICEASNSGYWNGLTNIRDLAGNPLNNIGLTSASGFDYRFAHPDSPAPAAAPVPEPATWALLIGGFAMVGLAARSRRIVAA